jgi:ComF family protein
VPRCARRWADRLAALASTERWLLPGECLLCRAPTSPEDDSLVCAVCRYRWRPVPLPQCGRCGQPIDRGADCRVCLDWPPEVEQAASALWFDESVRLAVHFFKYEGWRRLADPFALVMRYLPPLQGAGVLVPIPLGAARARARGYNQSALLAGSLARLVNLPVAAHLLRRTRDTVTQTSLPPEGREANVRGVFTMAAEDCPPRVVLVDDVFTTGATLVAAARALVAHGVRQVAAVTLARAELPLAAASRSLDL